jgi:ElaB/YqjD/DUF883 family membrane-anchored ribosome-binding protein
MQTALSAFDPCKQTDSTEIVNKYDKLMKKQRDAASNEINKLKKEIKKSGREIQNKVSETSLSFIKNIGKTLNEAAKDIGKIVHMSGNEILRFAQNPGELEDDIADDIVCLVADVKTLLACKMAAIRKVSNLASSFMGEH